MGEKSTNLEKEDEMGIKRPGDRNRDSSRKSQQEKWEGKRQASIGGEGPDRDRGQSGVEGLPRPPLPSPAQLPGRAVVVTRTPAAGALPVVRPRRTYRGTCEATRDVMFRSPARARFRTGCPLLRQPLHPSPGHGARGDPELEKTPRQAPRPGAAERETGKCQGSAKPKCENSGRGGGRGGGGWRP